mgnify:CR=1 FL=1
MARKRIDDRTKEKVVEAHARGLSNKKIAEQFHISVSSVSRIIKEKAGHKKQEKSPQQDSKSKEIQKRITEIERRIAELEQKILYYEARKKGIKP